MFNYIQKFQLDGKIAYVVGGAGHIGKEVVKAFASAGAEIIILDKKNDKNLIKEVNDNNCVANFIEFDCCDLSLMEIRLKEVIDQYCTPDIFINCSYPRTKDWGENNFSNINLESFKKNIDYHLNSFSWLAKIVADEMVKNKIKGNIIQLGSIYGIIGQNLELYHGTKMSENMTYSVIKGGITNLTRQLASYYGQFNIRVNTLSPGGLEGMDSGKEAKQDETFKKRYSSKTPLNRLGTATEVASVALFLASDASSYISGANLIVDGGYSII